MRRSSDNIFKYVDWLTILFYGMLVAIGWMAIFTANYDGPGTPIFDLGTAQGRQLAWIIVCVVFAFIIQLFEGKFYATYALIFYALAMMGLITVLVFGQVISGSQSWIEVGGLGKIQPSEFAKFATALLLAKYLGDRGQRTTVLKDQITAGLFILLPAALILMQPDTGSALVFTSLILVMYREGLSPSLLILLLLALILAVAALMYDPFEIVAILSVMGLLYVIVTSSFDRYQMLFYAIGVLLAFMILTQLQSIQILVGFGALLALGVVAWFLQRKPVWIAFSAFSIAVLYSQTVQYAFGTLLKGYQQERILVMLGQIEDTRGIGYNLHQSLLAIGSGGPWGKGFLNGIINKGNFVPELSTDFIFCSIGEEFGFMGSVVLVSIFVALLVRIVQVAERQSSSFSRIYGYSVASILFFHFFINLSMTIGLAPIIGIPLPFISYGGSSLMGFTILIFIFIRLDIDREEVIK